MLKITKIIYKVINTDNGEIVFVTDNAGTAIDEAAMLSADVETHYIVKQFPVIDFTTLCGKCESDIMKLLLLMVYDYNFYTLMCQYGHEGALHILASLQAAIKQYVK